MAHHGYPSPRDAAQRKYGSICGARRWLRLNNPQIQRWVAGKTTHDVITVSIVQLRDYRDARNFYRIF